MPGKTDDEFNKDINAVEKGLRNLKELLDR